MMFLLENRPNNLARSLTLISTTLKEPSSDLAPPNFERLVEIPAGGKPLQVKIRELSVTRIMK
jgi:hypothetical protein